MSGTRELLDCTLRDGGYLNDWAFGRESISYIFDRLVSSNVDWIEAGFLDERIERDLDRTIQPDTDAYEELFRGFDKGRSRVTAMIDYGTCSLPHIKPRTEHSFLDAIRVIFKKNKMREALAFSEEVKALGYEVFVQAVSITSYSDEDLKTLISLVNHCRPYAVSMVDTYGLLDPTGLDHIREVIDRELLPGIRLGYHAHNNFQLGYANAVSILNTETERGILVDGTLYGMGKSAGNAPLELIAMYMNGRFGKDYDVLQMQEAISTSIMDLYMKRPWGYTLFYYIAALNRCHPDYVAYLMNKRTLSVSSINEILKRIPEAEKLNKNMALVEELYLAYQTIECRDGEAREALKQAFSGNRPVLVLGPGKTLVTERERIDAMRDKEAPVVVLVNQLPDGIPADYLFLTNSKRYNGLERNLKKNGGKVIATSNVKSTGKPFDYTLNYGSLIDGKAEFPDNSLLMLLRLFIAIGVREVHLAGFDGYTPNDINYYEEKAAYDFVKSKAEVLNGQVRSFLMETKDVLRVRFLTATEYEKGEET